mgnify:CR=1 FL=1|tara:strand:- start:287 stop:445 length:159 start_codon:yes stop_codon:yes gene_type:complete
MKLIVLIFLIIIILSIFRFIRKDKNTNDKKNVKSKTIDLEIDPKTKEYKPKE